MAAAKFSMNLIKIDLKPEICPLKRFNKQKYHRLAKPR